MAPQETADSQIEPFHGAVLFNSLNGILTACRSEPAGGRCQWRYAPLIESYGKNQESAHEILLSREVTFLVMTVVGKKSFESQRNAMSHGVVTESLCRR